MFGVSFAVIAVLVVIVILLGLKLWAVAHPTGKVASDFAAAKTDLGKVESEVETDLRRVEPTVSKVENAVRADIVAAIDKTETWFLDWSAEDKAIADATASKATKQQLARDHVAKLQAALLAADGS